MSTPPLTDADVARQLFQYNADTGHLIWRTSNGRAKAGKRAGWIGHSNHRQVRFLNRNVCEHRVIWLYFYGKWPSMALDHINGDPGDNRITNLRLATIQQNNYNSVKQHNNKSGYKGVNWHKGAKRWVAQISAENKKRHLGYFTDVKEAYAAYCKAAKELHGEFSRT